MNTAWRSAALTHRGNRRTVNEDAVLDRCEAGLWAVADGLGGHFGGRLASRAVVRALRGARLPGTLADRVDALDDLLQDMNHRLRRRAQALGHPVGMGTTVVAVTVCGGTGAVLWAGDSRLYRLRDGALDLVTRDHTPLGERSDAGEDGGLSAVDDSHIVTRAVGCHSSLQVDVAVFDVHPGDVLLLCSDGLYRELGPAVIAAALDADEPGHSVAGLLGQCLAGPARDNVSVVVARLGDAAGDVVRGKPGGADCRTAAGLVR